MTWNEWFEGRFEPDLNTGCFLWFGRINDDGYGLFNRASYRGLAHRKSYEVSSGPIPAGMVVMHTCDVRCCVNPKHLKLGTQLENIQDRVSKKRCSGGDRSGENSRVAKLTWNDVHEIRRRAEMGESHSKISIDYPVVRQIVSKIISGQLWRVYE